MTTILSGTPSLIRKLERMINSQTGIMATGKDGLVNSTSCRGHTAVFKHRLRQSGHASHRLLSRTLGITTKTSIVITTLNRSSRVDKRDDSHAGLRVPSMRETLLRRLLGAKGPIILILFANHPLILA